MNYIVFDKSLSFSTKIDDVTGFLTANVNLARIGIQKYLGKELGLTDRANEIINVFRPPEEVFHEDSIKGYTNLVVTEDHPKEAVTIDNVKTLQRGTVSNIEQSNTLVKGVVTVTDKKLIDKINKGKIEVSVGYQQDLKEEKGEYLGSNYEYIQTNIRPNHLAIVDAGRCGSQCRILNDKGKGNVMKITIDGIEYTVEDEQLAQAIRKFQETTDKSKEEMQKELDEEKKKNEKLGKELDKSKATKDAMEKTILSDEAINDLVTERASLLAEGKDILGDKMPECGCPTEVKKAVIDKVIPDMDLTDKSNDYIDAAYDMAVSKYNKAKDSNENLSKDILDKKGNKITRDSVRQKYVDSTLTVNV